MGRQGGWDWGRADGKKLRRRRDGKKREVWLRVEEQEGSKSDGELERRW